MRPIGRLRLWFAMQFVAVIYGQGWRGGKKITAVSVLDSGAEGFKSQPRRCWVSVLGKLFTPIVPLFTEQRNW